MPLLTAAMLETLYSSIVRESYDLWFTCYMWHDNERPVFVCKLQSSVGSMPDCSMWDLSLRMCVYQLLNSSSLRGCWECCWVCVGQRVCRAVFDWDLESTLQQHPLLCQPACRPRTLPGVTCLVLQVYDAIVSSCDYIITYSRCL